MPKILDMDGLRLYHNNVVKALDEKANKIHIGLVSPSKVEYDDVWLETEEEETVSVMSLDDEVPYDENEDLGEEVPYDENEDLGEEVPYDENEDLGEEITL